MHIQESTTARVRDAAKAGVVDALLLYKQKKMNTVHKTAFINMSEDFNLLIRARLHRR